MIIFDNLPHAIAELNNHAFPPPPTLAFVTPSNPNLLTVNDVVISSVGSNIFRALQTFNGIQPSIVYRAWANAQFNHIINIMQNCNTPIQYANEIHFLTNDLLNYWQINTGGKLTFGPASKMINLLVKFIQQSPIFNIPGIIHFQHVPFDEFTIKPFRNIINELTDVNYKITIPTNPTMSSINTKEIYDIFTSAITNLYTLIPGAPPKIYYDYWAWDNNH